MNSFRFLPAWVLVLLAVPALAQQNVGGANPISDLGVEFYSQGGVVVDGIAYFTSDDGAYVPTGLRSPDFHSVVAFDVRTLRKVRTYPIAQTYDSSPFLFQKKDGTWLVIAHEYKNMRTVACRRDTGQVEWTSEANQPGSYFFGYSSFLCPDGTQLILMACRNGLHAMSGENGKDVWWVKEQSTGGITPCIDQQHGCVYYQCDGKVLKIRAAGGGILKEAGVKAPSACVSWNTVLVNDSQGHFVATRWYGKPEWDSAIRVFDKDLNLVWERCGLPIGKKDTLTYAEGRLVTGSGNHWSKKYEGDAWKYVAAYAIADGSILWRCDLSHIPYESLFNLPYFNGHFYAETTGGDHGPSKLLRIRASDGKLMEVFDYGRSISSCAPSILASGRVLSGDLGEDRVVVTEVAENSRADWPGPFGDPQTNQFALPQEPGVRLAGMKEIRQAGETTATPSGERNAGPQKTDRAGPPLAFDVKLDVVRQELRPDFCWFHPRVAAVPGAGRAGQPAVIMTLQKHLGVSDHYSGLWMMRTDDLGKSWAGPTEIPELAWNTEPGGVVTAVADVTPGWHPQTGKLIAMGCTVRYGKKGEQLSDVPRFSQTAYAVHDPKTGRWSKWRVLELPGEDKFNMARNACAQWLVRGDGTLLVPIYFAKAAGDPAAVTVLHCAFDGEKLTYLAHGDELSLDVVRGLCEPSIVAFQDRFYLTIRNDIKGYVTAGGDGLHYQPIKPWTFDDGSELGSYNTQQHWLAHGDGLFLAYTRRGADNDHIPRNRAPIFLAQVDPERLCVIRKSERAIIPERGAMLGNFGASAIDSGQSWVTDAEYMVKGQASPRGANGSVFAARVLWSRPNDLAPRQAR